MGSTTLTRKNLPTLQGNPPNELMTSIMLLVRTEDWPIAAQPAVAGAEKVLLAPTVVKFDAKGKALAELATIQKRELVVDILPWTKWVQVETETPDEKLARLMLETVIVQLHRTFMADPPNISMVRKGKRLQCGRRKGHPYFFQEATRHGYGGRTGGSATSQWRQLHG